MKLLSFCNSRYEIGKVGIRCGVAVELVIKRNLGIVNELARLNSL